jgi:putative transposase
MPPSATPERYKYHRFPGEIVSHGVWLYYRFPLSYRDVQELLFERGIHVTYEAIRQWCRKFGQDYANQLKRRRPRPGDKWHLDEVFLTIHGERQYLWRAVDQDDNVLDILVQSRRNKKAAKKFFRKLLKGLQYVPRVLITDKLKSYGAAKREILPGVEHRQSRYLNNRCENSHRPTRQVVYPAAADNVMRFLPIRLRRVNQPVLSTPNVFSILLPPSCPASEHTSPLHSTLINRHRFLGRLRLRPRRHAIQ